LEFEEVNYSNDIEVTILNSKNLPRLDEIIKFKNYFIVHTQ